jgi:hypothetical protein
MPDPWNFLHLLYDFSSKLSTCRFETRLLKRRNLTRVNCAMCEASIAKLHDFAANL